MQYYVCGNLRHDGQEYRRGDKIDLSEEEALSLQGIVSTERPEDPASAQEEAAEQQHLQSHEVARVGGKSSSMGEPGVDMEDNHQSAENARDVTPQTTEEAHAAPAQEKKPKRRAASAKKEEKEPEADPSANL